MWGFWDGDHWKNNSPLYHKDWSLKPAGRFYRDLVLGQWLTIAKGEADETGTYVARGFLGDYQVTARSGAKQKSVQASLSSGGAQISIAL
jgi:hypothetical protein